MQGCNHFLSGDVSIAEFADIGRLLDLIAAPMACQVRSISVSGTRIGMAR